MTRVYGWNGASVPGDLDDIDGTTCPECKGLGDDDYGHPCRVCGGEGVV